MHKEFTFHKLNASGIEKAKRIATLYDQLLTELEDIVTPHTSTPLPSSREMAICRTKLEESCFFAKKAMASQPENGDPDT